MADDEASPATLGGQVKSVRISNAEPQVREPSLRVSIGRHRASSSDVPIRAPMDDAMLKMYQGSPRRHSSLIEPPEGVTLDKHWALKEVFKQVTDGSRELVPRHVRQLLLAAGGANARHVPSDYTVKLVMTDLAQGELCEHPEDGRQPSIGKYEFVQASSFIIDECDPREDLEEIWRLMLLPEDYESREALEKAELDAAGLCDGLARLGCNMSEEEVMEFITFEGGGNGDDPMTYSQFQQLVMKNCAADFITQEMPLPPACRRRSTFRPAPRSSTASTQEAGRGATQEPSSVVQPSLSKKSPRRIASAFQT